MPSLRPSEEYCLTTYPPILGRDRARSRTRGDQLEQNQRQRCGNANCQDSDDLHCLLYSGFRKRLIIVLVDWLSSPLIALLPNLSRDKAADRRAVRSDGYSSRYRSHIASDRGPLWMPGNEPSERPLSDYEYLDLTFVYSLAPRPWRMSEGRPVQMIRRVDHLVAEGGGVGSATCTGEPSKIESDGSIMTASFAVRLDITSTVLP